MRSKAEGSSANSKRSNEPFLSYLTSYKMVKPSQFHSWSNNSEMAHWIA